MVDEAVVADKLRLIDGYLEDLEQLRGIERAAYVEDMVTQRAVERTFMNLIQSVIDVAGHVRSTEDLGPAETSREEVQALGDAGIITAETRSKMEEAVGFRNVLAHRIRRRQSPGRLRRSPRGPGVVRAIPGGNRSLAQGDRKAVARPKGPSSAIVLAGLIHRLATPVPESPRVAPR